MTTTRTITLTNRPPVKIIEADWPVLSTASYHDWDGEHECQAFRHWKGLVSVRQHADGRALVYARCWHESNWQGERGYDQRAGELLGTECDTEAIVDAIKHVHATIDIVDEGHRDDWRLLADECIADLPAEEL